MNSSTIKKLILFLALNFLALFLGSLFTASGVSSSWYQMMNKAPWTPPGWVFGAAWTLIMVCFSFYMAYLFDKGALKKNILILFGLQWILNIIWNPVFFHFHNIILGLFIISLLTLTVMNMLVSFWNNLKWKSILILPYLIWLCIATSLNLYAYIYN